MGQGKSNNKKAKVPNRLKTKVIQLLASDPMKLKKVIPVLGMFNLRLKDYGIRS